MPPAEIRIRDMVPGDAAALAIILEEIGFPDQPERMASRMEQIRGPGFVGLVAEVDARVCGVLTALVYPVLHRNHPVGRITLLAVARAHRSLGIGRALMTQAENQLAGAGCRIIEVISNRRYQTAHAFYQRLGYRQTSLKFKKVID